MNYAFENLEVWQKSRMLVKSVYQLTQDFPSEEKFGLTNQLRRASVSVSSNIAEGSTRWSRKDQARFYEIAFGSLMEVLNQLILSFDLKVLNEDSLINIRQDIDTIGRMLNSLHLSTKKDSNNNPINPAINQQMNPSTYQLINSSTKQQMNRSTDQPINLSTSPTGTKYLLTSLALMAAFTTHAANDWTDTFFRSGKYFVVVAVLTIIFVGIVVYLIRLDRKISKLEKKGNQ